MLLEPGERIAAIAVGFRVIRIELDGLVEALQRGLVLLQLVQRAAAIAMGFREAGAETDGPVEAFHRFRVSPQRTQRDTAVRVRLGDVRIAANGRVGQLHRDRRLAELAGHHAEQIERVDVAGRNLKDLTIERLRLRQPAGTVMRHCFLQLVIEHGRTEGLRIG